jgi:cytochrome c biogenesis protein CcdA
MEFLDPVMKMNSGPRFKEWMKMITNNVLKMKKYISKITSLLLPVVLLGAVFLFQGTNAHAQQGERAVTLHFLQRDDCTHCQDQKEFHKVLLSEDVNINIISHDIYDPEERELFDAITESAKLPKVTPVTFIEGYIVQGFNTNDTTGKQIKEIIAEVRKGSEEITLESFLENPEPKNILDTKIGCEDGETTCGTERPRFDVAVPFFGTINLFEYSLPSLALILGFVDGFNPCAMWVLVVFLTVLIDVGSKKKMWQVAGIFIIAEAIMYYLILNVWFTTWDFVGLDAIVTPLVGIIAIGAGLFFLNEWRRGDATCKVTSSETRKKTMNRISNLVKAEMTIATIVGILLLAFSVNIIEFACSIGIPQAFTKILDLNPVDFVYKQFLMLLYILMYMVDDLIVFGIALYSFEKIGITTKYTHASHLIGGVLMLILGILLTFFPQALVFF